MSNSTDVTILLRAWKGGDRTALDRLVPLIYSELRRIAAHHLRKEPAARTLQPTALVHEAYLRLVADGSPDFTSRVHFLSVSCRVIRRILVENARARRASKRGSGEAPIPLDDSHHASPATADVVIALNDALSELELQDAALARIIELKYFGGLTAEESSGELGLTIHQVNWQLRMAHAWIRREMKDAARGEAPQERQAPR